MEKSNKNEMDNKNLPFEIKTIEIEKHLLYYKDKAIIELDYYSFFYFRVCLKEYMQKNPESLEYENFYFLVEGQKIMLDKKAKVVVNIRGFFDFPVDMSFKLI